MASKLISIIQKLRLDKALYRGVRSNFNKTVSLGLTKSLSYKYFRLKNNFKNLNISSKKLINVKIYKSGLRYVPKKHIASRLICPFTLNPGSFLGKGCSAAIVSVTNSGYESQIVLKQPYKYGEQFLKNESQYLLKLNNHPNIVECIGECLTNICGDPEFQNSCPDVEHAGYINSIILERMETNLEELLRTTELSTIDRVDILSQILEAQVYMRHKSICHRDLKPSNILVKYVLRCNTILQFSARFLIKVADFDCAVDLNVEDNFYHQGTPSRTPPEILNISKKNHINLQQLYSKSDIWAIGTIAYEIFGNENPFLKVEAKHYALIDLPPMPSAPNVIQKLIKCLLEPDPKSRYQSCIASDILQLFRLKTILSADVYKLFKEMSLDMIVGCCYLHQMYWAAERFISDNKRMQFAFNFIDD